MIHHNTTERLEVNSSSVDTQSLECCIMKRIGRSILDLQIKVENEGLIMEGTARSYYVKQLAQEVVMEMTNAPIIDNAIHVTQLTKAGLI